MNLAAYIRELRFAVDATEDWKSRMALIGSTIGFHLGNLSRRRASMASRPITVRVRIGDASRQISFRPHSGDRFKTDVEPMNFRVHAPGAFGGVRAVTAHPNN